MSRQRLTIDNVDNRFTTTNLTNVLEDVIFPSGTAFIVTENANTVLTLPEAVPGINYCLYVAVDMTHSLIITHTAGHQFRANLRYVDKDTDGPSSFAGGSTTEGYIYSIGTETFIADADNKGRLRGTLIEIRCFVAGEWYVTGTLVGNGAVGSPFSD